MSDKRVLALEELLSTFLSIIGPLQPPDTQAELASAWNVHVDYITALEADKGQEMRDREGDYCDECDAAFELTGRSLTNGCPYCHIDAIEKRIAELEAAIKELDRYMLSTPVHVDFQVMARIKAVTDLLEASE